VHGLGKITFADCDWPSSPGLLNVARIVYAQLILEQARLTVLDPDVLDTIFEVFVRDSAVLAAELHGKASSTEAQQQWALANVRKPVIDTARLRRVWQQLVALSGAYQMSP
jgi:acyl-CoA dehydrogenase